jgi:hypothetical protein
LKGQKFRHERKGTTAAWPVDKRRLDRTRPIAQDSVYNG